MQIGPYILPNPLLVAPMAGVTDRPFRVLCKTLGAGYAVSEMMTSQPQLWATLKSQRRMDHAGEVAPIAVQIAGTEPEQMADAARFNIAHGAQIIDINMGCPAKKVCNKWAGSALMQNEPLALRIIEAVVKASEPYGVPVTLKMRTGWCSTHKNARQIAIQAEMLGVQMIVVHGRTREQGYKGQAEYVTVADIKSRLRIPVVANGDIDSPEKAKAVLDQTGVDGLMVGRAAQGRPWLFREIEHFLITGQHLAAPLVAQVKRILLEHLANHHDLYGPELGVRSARKHIAWYVRDLPGSDAFREKMNLLTTCTAQLSAVGAYFAELAEHYERLPLTSAPATVPLAALT